MKYKKSKLIIGMILLLLISITLGSCKKDFLDSKPISTLVVPTTVGNFQALLDNPGGGSDAGFSIDFPGGLGELGSDDYYISQTQFDGLDNLEKYAYYWYGDVFNGTNSVIDWDASYTNILVTNLILEGLNKITPNASSQAAWSNVEGSALFDRAQAYYYLSQEFCKPYDENTSKQDLGLPLKLSSDVNKNVGRSTVQATYDEIIGDFKSALKYLPLTPLNNNRNRPSKPVCYAMLARTYLSMADYANAYLYADSSLIYNHDLMNFNGMSPLAPYVSIGTVNPEVYYDTKMTLWAAVGLDNLVDSTIYASYDTNDIRKTLWFYSKGNNTYRYYEYRPALAGIATDEMLLTRAECEARGAGSGGIAAAMNDLNTLLVTRYVTGTYINHSANNGTDALNQILVERRKEMIFRGTRWTDLRRLNKDPNYAVTLVRHIDGKTYTLPPNDPRYVYPIPQDEELYNPIPQNVR